MKSKKKNWVTIFKGFITPDDNPYAKDWTRDCEVCDARPVVNITGLCGPCTWGESETINGNW